MSLSSETMAHASGRASPPLAYTFLLLVPLGLVAALPVLALDREAAAHAAGVRQQLETAGAKIGLADSLIAGIALKHRLPLWTRNRKHFERVEGLRLAGAEGP